MVRFVALPLLVTAVATPALAQSDGVDDTRPGTVLAEAAVSHTTFDSGLGHVALGGGVRIHAARRLSFGVEVQQQVGDAPNPHLFPTVTATLDLREARFGSPGHVQPFLTVAAGFIGHSNEFDSSGWPALAGGGGLRVWLSRRLYLTAGARAGAPLHTRVAAGVGLVLR